MGEATKRLPLEHRHRELGGKMVPFAGYTMPMQFTGIKEEHHAVRNNVGLFDVSHMGEIEFRGPDAIACVNRLVTNDVSTLVDGKAMYSAMCNEDGGIVDDLVLYRLAEDHVLVVVNAANREKDFAHMKRHASGNVELVDRSDAWVQLALQGPNAQALLSELVDVDLDPITYYTGRFVEVAGHRAFVSRTGYTGEDGFEIYIDTEHGEALFDALVEVGRPRDMALCGLGCRDTLRLEAKYLLYGNDMDETTNPLEAGLGWVVKLDKDVDFVGKEAIARVKEQGVTRRLRGLVLEGRGVIRPDYAIFAGDTEVGRTTSGTFSPTLERSIGLGYIDVSHANDDTVDIDIRARRVEAAVTKKAFYKRED